MAISVGLSHSAEEKKRSILIYSQGYILLQWREEVNVWITEI